MRDWIRVRLHVGRLFAWSIQDNPPGAWVRLGLHGPGLSIGWRSRPLFSERYGYYRVFRLGPLSIKYLPGEA